MWAVFLSLGKGGTWEGGEGVDFQRDGLENEFSLKVSPKDDQIWRSRFCKRAGRSSPMGSQTFGGQLMQETSEPFRLWFGTECVSLA